MLSFLKTTAEPNDVIILHACAHNPTGTDLTKSQWIELADLVKEKKLFPVFDSAYQGFATGDVDADAWSIRYFTEPMLSDADSRLPSVCVAQSFSKNFGLYGERVGALHLVVPRGLSAEGAKSRLTLMARAEYSSPVKFGASIVETVLGDGELRAQWEKNLVTVSWRLKTMRSRLRSKLEEYGAYGDWTFIERQIGMFCYTGLSPDQVMRLREEYHVYLMPSGRLSICGLTQGNVDYVARAICAVVASAEL
jgi:aspartate/tyrosine/aromatic aminotransferase